MSGQVRQRGLGRGFDALIPTQVVDTEFDPTAKTTGSERVADPVLQIKPDQIKPNPHQPRTEFAPEALAQLADSIRVHGILQPLVVTKVDDGYELIAGERRLRASKQAGLETVPVIVRSFDEQQKLELALIENIQRAELNPLETATAYRKLVDQFNLKLEDLSRRVGRDETTISNTMRLLNLPLEAKRALVAGKITEGHARVVLTVREPEKQALILSTILARGFSVRQAEEFARGLRMHEGSVAKAHARVETSNDLTKSLGEYLGTKVQVKPTAKGGQLVIAYYSDEELQRIYDKIKPEAS